MGLVQDIREEVLLECDPGKDASSYQLLPVEGCWLPSFDSDAQEILRHARNECEDQDHIEFVRRIEHASENALIAS
jgi:hypothetical protein